jgi:hypothetical protein
MTLSSSHRTRGAARKTSRYSTSATLAQKLLGVTRMIRGDKLRHACAVVNKQSPPDSPHKLAKSTLHRLFTSLPPSLITECLASSNSDVLIMDFIQNQQSEQRRELVSTLTLLTSAEEALLVQWIELRSDMNNAAEREEVISQARLIVERERQIECTSSMRGWFEGFMRRHPHLTSRISQGVKEVRLTAQANEDNIANYFRLLKQFIHLRPEQIYAADETGLDGDGARKPKVIVPKGTKRPTQQQDSYREHTSILHIGSAAGDSHPMAVMFKGTDKLDVNLMKQLPAGAVAGVQKNGYFTSDSFMSVLEHFHRYAVPARPVLLIIDGAKAHLDDSAVRFAKSEQIDILCLPSNTTHLLQVADVSLFRPFKLYWQAGCKALKHERSRTGEERGIKRQDIVPLLAKAWAAAMTRENVQSGFRKTGIYPFNPAAYKQNLTRSPSDLPLLLTPAVQVVEASTTLPSIAESLPLHLPSPTKASPCKECGQTTSKRTVKRTLSTKKGLLLTGDEALETFRLIAEDKQAESKEKQRKAEERAEKKRKREVEDERLKGVREERAAKRLAAAQQPKTRKRERVSTEKEEAAAVVISPLTSDENRNPNTEASAVVVPSSPPSPPPPPPPSPVSLPVPSTPAPVIHGHGTRHAAKRMKAAAMR